MMLDSFLGSILLSVTGGGLALLSVSGEKFVLSSSAFGEGNSIPTVYAYTGVQGGKNSSPPLKWTNPSAEPKSFALACIDRHPIASNWIHWIVIDIPKSANSLAEGASRGNTMPAGSKELKNSFGTLGWGGPQPPKGSGTHNYEFIVYALSVEKLNLPVDASLAAFNKAIEGKVMATARLVGTYER